MVNIEQRIWTRSEGWDSLPAENPSQANLVLVFGETHALKENFSIEELRRIYPEARIVGCSTSGEICGPRVLDDSITTTAIRFSSTRVRSASVDLADFKNSFEAGLSLGQKLDPNELVHVLVFSVGLNVNGSELVKGLSSGLPKAVTLSGGLAGDMDRFAETLVICDGSPSDSMVAVVGLYGKNLKIGTASMGGWNPFGPQKIVTKSEKNILYELNGKSALELYKKYLGNHASELPGSALLFPLSIQIPGSEGELVRTILSIDEEAQSMTFAGDIPEGSKVRLMNANFDRLIGGAVGAAELSLKSIGHGKVDLALLISCVGRKLVLKQRVEEELEGVKDILPQNTVMTGFYSYGEVSAFNKDSRCELHNQTMTITTLAESDETPE